MYPVQLSAQYADAQGPSENDGESCAQRTPVDRRALLRSLRRETGCTDASAAVPKDPASCRWNDACALPHGRVCVGAQPLRHLSDIGACRAGQRRWAPHLHAWGHPYHPPCPPPGPRAKPSPVSRSRMTTPPGHATRPAIQAWAGERQRSAQAAVRLPPPRSGPFLVRIHDVLLLVNAPWSARRTAPAARWRGG